MPTAAAWAGLLAVHGVEKEGMHYPDWQQVAGQYDAVHMCLAAVIATQGLATLSGGARIAPMFWDVETTLWLRWAFAEPETRQVST